MSFQQFHYNPGLHQIEEDGGTPVLVCTKRIDENRAEQFVHLLNSAGELPETIPCGPVDRGARDDLPARLSQLLIRSLYALRLCEAKPDTYTVRMNNFHTAHNIGGARVGLAGAYMAVNLRAHPGQSYSADNWGPLIGKKLRAVREASFGRVAEALGLLGYSCPGSVPGRWDIPSYGSDPRRWHDVIADLADHLAGYSL